MFLLLQAKEAKRRLRDAKIVPIFFRKEIDKYSWVDIGSSYLLNDVSAAYLWAQIQNADIINKNRLTAWNLYRDTLSELEQVGHIELPTIPEHSIKNNHIFYIKVSSLSKRTELIKYLRDNDIESVFHYVPLHSSLAGITFGRFNGHYIYTTKESNRIIRLPMYFGLKNKDVLKISDTIKTFFIKERSDEAQ